MKSFSELPQAPAGSSKATVSNSWWPFVVKGGANSFVLYFCCFLWVFVGFCSSFMFLLGGRFVFSFMLCFF